MNSNKRRKGQEYERIAADFLEKQGLKILQRNFRCRLGEIDIIAKDQKYLVFVEVKYRKTGKQGCAVSAVNRWKQKIICKVSQYYMMKYNLNDLQPCRYDVIGIDDYEIQWIKSAFEFVE